MDRPLYPVIFVHGIKSGASTWDSTRDFLKAMGWRYGGTLAYDRSSGNVTDTQKDYLDKDFYTISFSSNNELLFSQQGYELQKIISAVLSINPGKSKVILVGHSMGGLAARAYLQGEALSDSGALPVTYRGDVGMLITVGTPNFGVGAGGLVLSFLFAGDASVWLSTDSPLIADLNNTSLHPLPKDVVYRSIIGNNSIVENNIWSASADGDGIVTTFSQNLANVPGSSALRHRAIPQIVATCNLFVDLLPVQQVHTCEPSDPNARETILNEIISFVDIPQTPTGGSFLIAPTPTSPSVGTGNLTPPIVFNWSSVVGATSYRIMIADDFNNLTTDQNTSVCASCLNTVTGSNSYTLSPSTLKAGTTYYWRVKAISQTARGFWSVLMNFSTASAPVASMPMPAILTPTAGASNQPSTPTLTWTNVNNATSYRVVIADSPTKLPADAAVATCSACIVNDTPSSNTYQVLVALKFGTTYYWAVKARNVTSNSFSSWSSQSSFTTKAVASDTTPPSDGILTATAGIGQVSLLWSGYSDVGSGIASYRVVYAANSAPTSCNSGTQLLTGLANTLNHTSLANGNTYFYRVCAVDNAGNMSFGATATATPQVAAPSPTGSIQVNFFPSGSVSAGAQWRIVGQSTFHGDNEVVSGLPFGGYTIEFKPVAGYNAPLPMAVGINNTGTTTFTGIYVLIPVAVFAGVDITGPKWVHENSHATFSAIGLWNDGSSMPVSATWSVTGTGAIVDPASGVLTTSSVAANTQVTITASYTAGGMTKTQARIATIVKPIGALGPQIAMTNGRVAAGVGHSVVLKSDGTVWTWGWNILGQLGNGSPNNSVTPVQVSGLSGVRAVSAGITSSFAVKADGTVWAWGGSVGGLGDGTTMSRSTPVQVVGLTNVIAISAGANQIAALKSDGTVWMWGDNLYGQLGPGAPNTSAVPRQVSGLSSVIALSSGDAHVIALKSDGTVWAWGHNDRGQVGDGSFVDQSAPVQVPGLSGIVAISAGPTNSAAIAADGFGYVWGDNSLDYLGDGGGPRYERTPLTAFLQGLSSIVGGSPDRIGLVPDGRVWFWGGSSTGELNHDPAPVQITGLNGIVEVASYSGHSLAMKADGTVWAWGTNDKGQAGNGTSSDPAQVGQVVGSGGTGFLDAGAIAVDNTPDAFTFAVQSNQPLSTVITSDAVTVTGINTPTTISISGGEYSVNGTSYSSAARTVINGDVVTVRLTDSASNSTMTCATLTVGGVPGQFCATTQAAAEDTTPDAFSFTSQTGIGPSTVVTSNTITPTGYNAAVPISVNGGSYSINGSSFVTTAGTISPGQSVAVRVTSSGSFSTTTTTTLTIGGVPGTFSATTQAAPVDTTPDQFSFTPQTGVALNTVVTSNTITVSGVNTQTPFSITGGSYVINGNLIGTTPGNTNNGATFAVKVTSSASFNTQTCATLTIGGVSGTFCATTLAAASDTTPDAFTFSARTGVAPTSTVTSNTVTLSGINAPSSISVSGGTYSVNGGTYTASAGTVNSGNAVSVRLTASGNTNTQSCATLTIGGVSAQFCATTGPLTLQQIMRVLPVLLDD